MWRRAQRARYARRYESCSHIIVWRSSALEAVLIVLAQMERSRCSGVMISLVWAVGFIVVATVPTSQRHGAVSALLSGRRGLHSDGVPNVFSP